MRVESSLAEMLMNAIASGRVWGVQFMRKHGKEPGDERRTFEALNRVIEKRLDSALAVARENGQRELAEQRLRAEAAESRLGEIEAMANECGGEGAVMRDRLQALLAAWREGA